MAVSLTVAHAVEPLVSLTISATGASASTAHVVSIAEPSGHTKLVNVTSDGAGAFSFKFTPQVVGNHTLSVRPTAEHNGTTTAAATATVRCKS